MHVFYAAVSPAGRQVSAMCWETWEKQRRRPVSFTTANMATATKLIQRLRNFLSGVSNNIRHTLKGSSFLL